MSEKPYPDCCESCYKSDYGPDENGEIVCQEIDFGYVRLGRKCKYWMESKRVKKV